MRVIAGQFKGARISTKSGAHIRPTSDRVKEWIFQVIEPALHGSYFLDLFAGSGSLGIEALSRGAAAAAFVDRKSTALIKKNIEKIAPESEYRIVAQDVLRFLNRRTKEPRKFTVIAADPPYDYNRLPEFLEALCLSNILEPGGIFFLESDRHVPLKPPDMFLTEIRIKDFGDTRITIFQKEQT